MPPVVTKYIRDNNIWIRDSADMYYRIPVRICSKYTWQVRGGLKYTANQLVYILPNQKWTVWNRKKNKKIAVFVKHKTF